MPNTNPGSYNNQKSIDRLRAFTAAAVYQFGLHPTNKTVSFLIPLYATSLPAHHIHVKMTETSAATRQGWSPDEKLDLLLAMLSVDNPKLVGRNWDVVAAKLVKKYPGKTREAAR